MLQKRILQRVATAEMKNEIKKKSIGISTDTLGVKEPMESGISIAKQNGIPIAKESKQRIENSSKQSKQRIENSSRNSSNAPLGPSSSASTTYIPNAPTFKYKKLILLIHGVNGFASDWYLLDYIIDLQSILSEYIGKELRKVVPETTYISAPTGISL